MKKALSIIISLVLVFSSLTFVGLTASGETSGNFKYAILDDGTVEVTGYIGEPTTLEIPSEIAGKTVTSIGYGAFEGFSSLTSIIIPNSVTNIGGDAFNNCTSLTSVTIGNSVTNIGVWAFYNCTSLASITIPDSVACIDDYAFYNCTSLTSLNIPDSVAHIGDYAFLFCTSLTNINVDKNNENYCDIDGVLFNKDKTELIQYPVGNLRIEYTIPNSVTSIDYGTFRGCTSLTSITIPDSVTLIGFNAFYDCSNDLIIYGYTDSEAERYANDNNIKFISLESEIPTNPTQPTTPTVTQPTQANNTIKPIVKFTVSKLSVKAPKLTSGKKLFKVKYTKIKDAVGFQVRYKTGKGKWKVKTFNTAKSATKVIKGLKKGKYKVQIRTFTKGKKVYSNWTKAKTVKVK